MVENSQSIWKKPVRLPQLLLIWLGLVVVIALITVVVLVVTNNAFPKEMGMSFLIFCAACATVLLAGWLLCRWIFCRHHWKRSLFGLACAATLVALFYAEEDWRGRHDWENYKSAGEAHGEKYDFTDYIPPAVPDDQNFAAAPIVADTYLWLTDKDGHHLTLHNTNIVDRLGLDLGDASSGQTIPVGNWTKGTLTDLKLWQNLYRSLAVKTNEFPLPSPPQTPAQDVLSALSKYDGVLAELSAAAQLPDSRFPHDYEMDNPANIYLPSLAALKRCSVALRLRAIAELQNGESDQACADVMLSLRLIDTIRTEPFLISQLVRFAMCDITLQPIYEGLAEHRWSNAQLAQMGDALARLDFLTDLQSSERGERAFSARMIDYYSKSRNFAEFDELLGMVENFGGDYGSTTKNINRVVNVVNFHVMPDGWYELNKIAVAEFDEQRLLPEVDPQKHQVFPEIADQASQLLATRKYNLRNVFMGVFLPAWSSSATKAARDQISVDLARTAVALERYRLAHGEYPETLDALAPQFIASVPNDVIGGQPLHYRREPSGKFVLYSVGWNGTDDGGVSGYAAGGALPDFKLGDWVWRYPDR